jgi:hypothetical protein
MLDDLSVVRAHCHRQDVVNRASRTHTHALSTPSASSVFWIPVGTDDYLRVIAAIGDVEYSDDLDVFARSHAARAENARRHVVPNDEISIAFVAFSEREIVAARRRNIIASHVLFELVAISVCWDLLDWISLEQHREHAASILHCGHRLCRDDHSVACLRRARRKKLRRSLYGDETDATIADIRELWIPTQRGHIDGELARGVKNCRAVVNSDCAAIDSECWHRLLHSSRDSLNKMCSVRWQTKEVFACIVLRNVCVSSIFAARYNGARTRKSRGFIPN